MADFPTHQDSLDTFEGRRDGFIYARFGHPTGRGVEARLAAVEGAEGAVLCASGMAAIGLTILAHCRSGDHILSSREQYGGVSEFLKTVAPDAGIEVTFLDTQALEHWGEHLRETTRLVLIESPSNPLSRIVDFEAIQAGRSGRTTNPLLVIDATLATPLGQDSLAGGFDLVLHSATKYLGGHDDLTAGVVLGKETHLAPIRERRRILGANLDPQTAWLLERGLKTLAVRWERQCASAGELARRLEADPRVDRVHYLGLPSHPHHVLARRQMHHFGGLLAFEVRGGGPEAIAVFDRLELISRAPSLGGVDTMVLCPATSSHRGLTAAERRAVGIEENLLRVSVGIEDVEDLWADLDQALGTG